MLRDLKMAAARRVGERDDALDARRGLTGVAVEHRVHDAAGAALDGEDLDAHRASDVVATPHDPRLLEHSDEHARIVIVTHRLRECAGFDDAAALPDDAVHRSQHLGRRHAAEREAPESGRVGVACEEDGVARTAVAARPADHLDVTLERVGK